VVSLNRPPVNAVNQAMYAQIRDRMTRHSRTALRHAKESLNAIEFMDLKSGYEFEQRMTGRLVAQPDAREAVTALREHCPPVYRCDFAKPGADVGANQRAGNRLQAPG